MEQPEPGPADALRPLVKLGDFRTLARRALAPEVFDYIDCGACDEITRRANRRDFDAIRLLPLSMRDVSRPELAMDLLGASFRVPIGFSPTALHRLVHEGGEVATARAAKAAGVPMVVSAMSSLTLEEIADRSGHEGLWLQTYVFRDRELTRELVGRAERAGYRAVVVSAGCPVVGKRDRNLANRFALPEGVTAANFAGSGRLDHNNPIHSFDRAELDPSLTWKDVEWLRAHTALPVLLKGIMNPRDVVPALEAGVSGIIVSNHGGRQLDTTASTISVLPEVARAVSGRVPLLVDSGFRRGTDVLKALALGADGVFLGRPVMWALAAGGEEGVAAAVELLADELRLSMQLAGVSSIAELRRNASHLLRVGSGGPAPPARTGPA
jgi:(S)-2-hydroxy-acid oxidase/4-hydroxymandelate oxidase